MQKKKLFTYPRVDWKTRVFNHTVDQLESLYPRKVAFITATYVLYMNGKGQVSLFRGIPEMLSTAKSSFSSTIVSHRCRIDACLFYCKRTCQELESGQRGILTNQQRFDNSTLAFVRLSHHQRGTRKKHRRLIFYHSVYCITEITINRLSVPFFLID